MQLKVKDYEKNEIIRIIREWTELSQENFAKSIYRCDRTIRAYESGETNYSFEMFLKICKIYDIEVIIRKNH